VSALNGWQFLNGGGNRPALDATVADMVDLRGIPFRASHEDVNTVATHVASSVNHKRKYDASFPNVKIIDAAS